MLITSKDNPKIKELSRLLSFKKERAQKGLFVIEGIRTFKEAVKEKADIKSVYITQEAYDKFPDVVCNDTYPDGFYIITDELARRVSDSVTPQGIFAVIAAIDRDINSVLDSGRVLVLNNLQDPGNIGTLLRTAEAVGINSVILCENCCELYNPKVIRSTMGSVFRLSIAVCDSFEIVVKALKAHGIKSFAAVVNKDAENIEQIDFGDRCAAVIGNEGNGLKDEHVRLCDRRLTISMKGNAQSLNASVAGAIILWEMTK